MEKINVFLDTAVEGIRDPKQKGEVWAELEDHIMEKYEEYKRRGYSEEEAEEMAVADMGDGKDLSEKMSDLHSVIPHRYYSKSVIVLLIGLLFCHLNFTIQKVELLPSWIGVILVSIALFLFYPLGKKSKIAFWEFTVGTLLSRLFAVIFEGIPVSAIFSFTLPIAMTLLCLDFLQVDKENKLIKWIIAFEWSYIGLVLLAMTVIFTIPAIFLMFACAITELIFVWKFARRAKDCDWKKNKNLHIVIPIVMAVVYVLSYIVPAVIGTQDTSGSTSDNNSGSHTVIIDLWGNNSKINQFEPTSNVWTGTKKDILITNGKELDDLLFLDDADAAIRVNLVQKYMSDEDYQKLASCTMLYASAFFNAKEEARYSVLGEVDGKCYFVEFFYYEDSAGGIVGDHLFTHTEAEYSVHGNYFYCGENGIRTFEGIPSEEGEYFYVLKGRDTFGYLFAEWEGTTRGVNHYYELKTHKMDSNDPARVKFENNWKKNYSIGKR